MADDTWRAVIAEPVPWQLDAHIQCDMFEWNQAADRVTLEDILKVVPLTSQVVQRTTAPGVSRYDIQEWIAKGKPTLTAEGWLKICKLITQKDYRVLGPIHRLCCQMLRPRSGSSQNRI